MNYNVPQIVTFNATIPSYCKSVNFSFRSLNLYSISINLFDSQSNQTITPNYMLNLTERIINFNTSNIVTNQTKVNFMNINSALPGTKCSLDYIVTCFDSSFQIYSHFSPSSKVTGAVSISSSVTFSSKRVVGAIVYAKVRTVGKVSKSFNITLSDNGVYPDERANDGTYSNLYLPSENGLINMEVLIFNGPNTMILEGDKLSKLNETFQIVDGGDGYIVDRHNTSYPPSPITTVSTTYDGSKISLSFISTGDQGNNGNASRYIIKWAKNMLITDENSWKASETLVNFIVPKSSGAQESFVILLSDLLTSKLPTSVNNITRICFSIRSTNSFNQTSPIGNYDIVYLNHIIPSPPDNPIWTIVLIGGFTVYIAITIVVAVVIYRCHKKNQYRRLENE